MKPDGVEAYPLSWPAGWPRSKYPQSARFDTSFTSARDGLFREIKLLGGTHVVLSSNLSLRRDGIPLAGQRQPSDKGVAVYFYRRGKQMAFACDRWNKIEDNIRAVAKTIEAVRGIDRWGASEMMERAFTAFEALPSPRKHAGTFSVCGVARQPMKLVRPIEPRHEPPIPIREDRNTPWQSLTGRGMKRCGACRISLIRGERVGPRRASGEVRTPLLVTGSGPPRFFGDSLTGRASDFGSGGWRFDSFSPSQYF